MTTPRPIAAPIISKADEERMFMRLKEAQSFSSQRSGEFYSRDRANGLETSGVALKQKGDTGEVIALVRQNAGSNNHILLLTNASSAPMASTAADIVPLLYARQFNQQHIPRNPSLEELHQTFASSLSQAVSDLPETVPQLAFAHIVPTPGHQVHAAFALSEGMVVMLTNVSSNHADEESHTNIIHRNQLTSSADIPDISTGMMSFPRGTKFILATQMDAYTQTQPLEAVMQVYQASRQILNAAQVETVDAFRGLSEFIHAQPLRDDVLNALSCIAFSPQYHELLKTGDDMGLAALVLKILISRSIKDKDANFILPERVAVMTSRVPTLRRRPTKV